MPRNKTFWSLIAGLILAGSLSASPANVLPEDLKSVGVSENIGATLPMDAHFINQDGVQVELKQYFKADRAVVLNLVYYNCPMLCNLILSGLSDAVREASSVKAGKKYEIVSISIDPKDGPKEAKSYQDKYSKLARIASPNQAWHFLTGRPDQIEKVAKSVGFRYYYDTKTNEYAHTAVLFFITPDGKISRYLYGISYTPFDFKMAVLEASSRKLISSVERVLLFCYNYDAHTRGYVLHAMNTMKVSAALTVLVLGLFLGWLTIKYRQDKDKHQ
jgi:protein SCO1/2